MPLVRYELRPEHSLANPELFRSAARDDPESLLEGVAMAGLVGIVRQLGDLAEYVTPRPFAHSNVLFRSRILLLVWVAGRSSHSVVWFNDSYLVSDAESRLLHLYFCTYLINNVRVFIEPDCRI